MVGGLERVSFCQPYYENTHKTNKNSKTWKSILTSTSKVDNKLDEENCVTEKETQTDIARDAYLVASWNKTNDIHQSYSTYKSENYKIVPDNEAGCFNIYDKQGNHLGAFNYADVKIRQDETTGKQLLISEHGTMCYDALVFNEELKKNLQEVMGKDALDTEKLQGFKLKKNSTTGIQYLVKDGEEGRGGKVLLQSESDRAQYEKLATTYYTKYPNLISDKTAGYIWPDLEIRGLAERTNQGILSIGFDGMSYSDNNDYKKNWCVLFSKDMYESIYDWLQNKKSSLEDIEAFETWQEIFEKLGNKYTRIWADE